MNPLPATLTVKQAAGLLRMGVSTAYDAINRGDFPLRVIRYGRSIRVSRMSAEELFGFIAVAAVVDQAEDDGGG